MGNIIPQGASHARVTDIQFRVRTLVDYDVNFLRDRVVSQVFVGDEPTGVYAITGVPDDVGPHEALDYFADATERSVIDEFIGLGYRKRVQELENELAGLRTHVNRPRWWQLRRAWAARKDEA